MAAPYGSDNCTAPTLSAGALRTALRSEDAQLPIQDIRTMDEVVDRSVASADSS